MAALRLLLLAAAVAAASGKTACSSVMPGDFKFSSCGTFCKVEKKANHCRYCKCKDCAFCQAAGMNTTAITAGIQGKPKKIKAKKLPAIAAAGSSAIAAPAGAISAAGSSAITGKKKCMSGLKGDYPFETCGAFCKAAKSANHCKFCKCKTCSFCGGTAVPTKVPPAAKAAKKADKAATKSAMSAFAAGARSAAAAPASSASSAAGGMPATAARATPPLRMSPTAVPTPPPPRSGPSWPLWILLLGGIAAAAAHFGRGGGSDDEREGAMGAGARILRGMGLPSGFVGGSEPGAGARLIRAGLRDESDAEDGGLAEEPAEGLDAAFRKAEALERSLKK